PIEVDTHGVRFADQFTTYNLQPARITGVRAIIARVKVAIDAGNRTAQLAGHTPGLVRDSAHTQDFVPSMRSKEHEVLNRTINLHQVNGPGNIANPVVPIT